MNIRLSQLVVLTLLLLYSIPVPSQKSTDEDAEKQFGLLNREYRENRLSKSDYLSAADSLIISFFVAGTLFEREELEVHLALFREIAWSEKDFKENRINYFEHFMNNALMQSKGGEAIYFSEKVSNEITGSPDQKSLVELFTKCMFYIKHKNYSKAINLYKEEGANIDAYPEALRSGDLSADEGLKLLHLLSIIITPCTELNDTTGVRHTVTTAENVAAELLPLVENDNAKSAMINILVGSMRYFRDIFLKDYTGAKSVLLEVRNLLDREQDLPAYISAPAEFNLLEWWIEYYLQIKDNSNAAQYLDRYANMSSISNDHTSMINTFRARLKANEGHFREGYAIMVEASKTKDELYANMMNELDQFAFASYSFLKRASLLLSVEHNSDRYSTSYGTKTAAYTVAGMKGSVRLYKFISAEGGINNIFDKNYSLTEGFPEAGRNFFVNIVLTY